MFDTQQISYETFKHSLHHGVYVFTSDVCQLCQEYKRDIEYVNNHYLYFVELSLESDRNEVRALVDRSAFPMTVGFVDGEQRFVRLGQLFGDDWTAILDFLKQFGEAPLTQEQIKEKEEVIEKACEITFYVFSDDVSPEDKAKCIDAAYAKHECPIDVDTLCPNLPWNSKIIMLKSFFTHYKFVYYNPRGNVGPDKTMLLTEYYKNQQKPMILRELDG